MDLTQDLDPHPERASLASRDVQSLRSIDGVVGSGKRLDADKVFTRLRPELQVSHPRIETQFDSAKLGNFESSSAVLWRR